MLRNNVYCPKERRMTTSIKLLISLVFSQLYTAQAQVFFLDSVSQLPIPAVNIYHSEGNLIGFTNKDGLLEFIPEVKNQNLKSATITAQHLSYGTKTIRIINEQQIVKLSPKTNQIKEINLAQPSADYVSLKGYYRSLETFNLRHKAYSDGIVEFYIPLRKGKIKYRLIDYRIYRDSAVVDDYNDKMGPFFQAPRVVDLYAGLLADRLKKIEVIESSNTDRKLLKKGVEVGNIIISEKGETARLYIDHVLPDSSYLEKIFRIEAKIRKDVSIENYTLRPFESLSPKDLRSVYQAISGSIKRKAEHGHIPYEVINEFYVIERSFLSREEYKKIDTDLIRNIYKIQPKSKYTHAFWEGLDTSGISVIPKNLTSQLGRNLQLVE